jgi:hypothetical protein
MIRDNILKYFKDRECVTLPRPIDSEEELKNLKNIKLEFLKPNFKLEFLNLKSKIYKEAKPKTFNNLKIKGPGLAKLISEFLVSINNGVVPNINNAWDSVVFDDIKKFEEKALNLYKSGITGQDLSFIEKVRQSENLKVESISELDSVLLFNTEISNIESYKNAFESSKNKLNSELSLLELKIFKEFTDSCKKTNINILKSSYKEIVNNMFKNKYKISENKFNDLTTDLSDLINKYSLQQIGPASENSKIFVNFYNENLTEIIYYICTSNDSEYKTQLQKIEINTSQINEEIKEKEKLNLRLEEKNIKAHNIIRHLERDLAKKDNDLKNLNNVYNNLLNELSSLKGIYHDVDEEPYLESSMKNRDYVCRMSLGATPECNNCNCIIY